MSNRKISPGKKDNSGKLVTLKNFDDLADVLRRAGKLREAEDLYRNGLIGREKIFGKDHPETLSVLHDLALILEAQRKIDMAEATFKDCIAARMRILGPNDPATCGSLFCLGDLYRKVNRRVEALEMFEAALKGYEHSLGKSHKHYKITTKRIATVKRDGSLCSVS